jgi:hypothetical protein
VLDGGDDPVRRRLRRDPQQPGELLPVLAISSAGTPEPLRAVSAMRVRMPPGCTAVPPAKT